MTYGTPAIRRCALQRRPLFSPEPPSTILRHSRRFNYIDIGIQKSDGHLASVRKNIIESDISQENKELLLDFGEDCLTGWKVPRVSKTRVATLLQRTKMLTTAINKSWHLFDERDSKKLLLSCQV
jgi:hypothetical protein